MEGPGGNAGPLLRSWGINTDAPRYVTQSGRVVRVGAKPGRPLAAGDLGSVVKRLRMTVPVLQQAKVDKHLRMLVLATLLKMAVDAGEVVPAPKGLMIHPLTLSEYEKYLKVLGGVTEDNAKEVQAQLKKLGLPEH